MRVYCPYCKKNVEYEVEKRNIKKFKGIEINTYENVSICKDCKNELYIEKMENENTKRIYNAYRKSANIISPEDIVKFRKKYNISQRELTSILDFGKMTINRYERGGVPTKSQSDYIKLIIKNEDKFVEKVKEAYKNKRITKKTYEKIVEKNSINISEEEKIQNNLKKYLELELKENPNIYNGYKIFDIEKVENIISYIASKVNNLTITSLNKYLWYIDMLSFCERSVSITGLTYQKQKYGPTIIDRKYDQLSLLNDKYIREDIETQNGNTTKIISNKNYDLNQITKNEKEIIDIVIKKLKNKSVSEISEMSHKEDGWKNTKMYEKISFEYAMNLNFIK